MMRRRLGQWIFSGPQWAILLLVLVGLTSQSLAQAPPQQPPGLQFDLGQAGTYSVPLQLLAIITLLSFLPAILISMTSFTRIIIVAHFLRQALGTQGAPSNQILIGLTLFLTMFVMGPTWDRVYDQAVVPYQNGDLTPPQALEAATKPVREFMLKNVREADLALFVGAAKLPQPRTPDDLPMRVIIPAFMISELKTAFQIGFVLFLPFLVIDMVVSSILLSIGMLQLPPIVISTPFKILLFVLVDGWRLVVGSVLEGFGPF